MTSSNYRHIKLNTSADDDVVIVAGVSNEADPSQCSTTHPSDCEAEGAKSRTGASSLRTNSLASKRVDFEAPLADPSQCSTTPPSASSKEYTPTTLDDIQQTKMSSTQVVVITVAIISLIAFIIWYIVF